ncbi:hypothetical protein Scep_019201 [Stephania cephalantha]|uniref:Uncharacterized protein n=1 Tax=Stephania cephalantha TaxID=152367 RepID=A0AAP0NL35_9MAGN
MYCPILVWNCKGVAGNSFLKHLKSIFSIHQIKIMVLMETRTSGLQAETIIKKIGFNRSHRIEAMGSSGIWILWKDGITIHVIQNNWQFIHMKVTISMEHSFLFTVVYESPTPGY